MSELMRRELRRSSYGWTVLAVGVAVGTLAVRAAGLVLVLAAVTVERGAAAAVAGAQWADEYVSGRAGLPPLAGEDNLRRAR